MNATPWTDRLGPTLTLRQSMALGDAIRWAQGTKRVRILVHGDRVIDGTCRSIGTEYGDFLRADDDIRGAYLRVSATMEHFIPMVDVVAWIMNGRMVLDMPD